MEQEKTVLNIGLYQGYPQLQKIKKETPKMREITIKHNEKLEVGTECGEFKFNTETKKQAWYKWGVVSEILEERPARGYTPSLKMCRPSITLYFQSSHERNPQALYGSLL